MSFTRALNPLTGDIFLSKGKFVYVAGAEEVRQRILVTLQHFYKEYFLKPANGIPWYNLDNRNDSPGLLGSKDVFNAEMTLREAVARVPGVRPSGTTNLEVTFANRKMTVSMTVEVDGANGPEVIDIVAAVVASAGGVTLV
jgi:hypothetical protein